MLQASHEQHQLLTQQNSQLQASLQDHQSRAAVLEGNLQREQQKTSDLTIEVQTLCGAIREMKTSWIHCQPKKRSRCLKRLAKPYKQRSADYKKPDEILKVGCSVVWKPFIATMSCRLS